MKLKLITFGLLSLALTTSAQKKATSITSVLCGGTILTMDEQNPTTDTLAFQNGIITAVGNLNGISRDNLQIINLNNKTAMPGFVEPHTHPDLAALVALDQIMDVGYVSSAPETLNRAYDGQKCFEDELKAIKAQIAVFEKKDSNHQSLILFGWDPIFYGNTDTVDSNCNLTWLDDSTSTPAKMIDERIGSSIPIAVWLQSMHTIYTNTKWMQKYGLDKRACDSLCQYCLKGPDSLPIGRFEESIGVQGATSEFLETAVSPTEFSKNISQTIDSYHEVGVSTIGVMGTTEAMKNALAAVALVNPLRMGVFLKGTVEEKGSGCATQKMLDGLMMDVKRPGVPSLLVNTIGTKFWYDGAPYTGSMYLDSLEQDYYRVDWLTSQLGIPQYARLYGRDPHRNYGHSNFPGAEGMADFQQALKEAKSDGILAVHAQGGQAGADVLGFYQNLNSTSRSKASETPVQYRLEHNGFIDPASFSNLPGTPVHLSFHVLHIYWYGYDFVSLFNANTLEHVMPIKPAVDLGLDVSFHTDYPMYPPNPLLTVRTAVTRKMYKNNEPFDSNGISVPDALKAVTINAAMAMNMEDQIGSLEVGKHADIVILEENPLSVDEDLLHTIGIYDLFLDGKSVLK